MIYAFTATPRSLVVEYGSVSIAGVSLSIARLGAMVWRWYSPGCFTGCFGIRRWAAPSSRCAWIVTRPLARHPRPRIYAITFGIGALMAAAAGGAMALVFPITPY